MQSSIVTPAYVCFPRLAAPALAQTHDGGFVVWDESIASAVRSGLPDEHRCGPAPTRCMGRAAGTAST